MYKKIIDKKILNLALDTSNYGLKKKTKHIASLKNKKCGDKIIIELDIKDKKILKMFYETESCIICQASASLLSKKIKNIPIKKIDKVLFTGQFNSLLSKKYLSRKDCVMLPYYALKKAI
tara:strand:- start:10033 stop:10392 length:360 start_codon:yes stop_codon:yes gene_type:complete